MDMTVKRLLESLGKLIGEDSSIADLEVATCLTSNGGSAGRAQYWYAGDSSDGERRLIIVSQPVSWRFGRPDSPAALRVAAEKANG